MSKMYSNKCKNEFRYKSALYDRCLHEIHEHVDNIAQNLVWLEAFDKKHGKEYGEIMDAYNEICEIRSVYNYLRKVTTLNCKKTKPYVE